MDKDKDRARKRLWWRKKRDSDPEFMERERLRLRNLGRAIRAKARELDAKQN